MRPDQNLADQVRRLLTEAGYGASRGDASTRMPGYLVDSGIAPDLGVQVTWWPSSRKIPPADPPDMEYLRRYQRTLEAAGLRVTLDSNARNRPCLWVQRPAGK